jgi:hypothetical protein
MPEDFETSLGTIFENFISFSIFIILDLYLHRQNCITMNALFMCVLPCAAYVLSFAVELLSKRLGKRENVVPNDNK